MQVLPIILAQVNDCRKGHFDKNIKSYCYHHNFVIFRSVVIDYRKNNGSDKRNGEHYKHNPGELFGKNFKRKIARAFAFYPQKGKPGDAKDRKIKAECYKPPGMGIKTDGGIINSVCKVDKKAEQS